MSELALEEAAARGMVGRTVADAMLRGIAVSGTDATVESVADFLGDHVHAALIVDDVGRLVAVVLATDLVGQPPDRLAAEVGTVEGRTVDEHAELLGTWRTMRALGMRRLAVTNKDGLLLGLLCMKRSLLGFCSPSNVSARRASNARSRSAELSPR